MTSDTKLSEQNIIKSAFGSCKRAFYFAFIFSFFISIFMLAMPIYSMQVLDRVLSSGSVETLVFLSLIILILFIFLGILTAIRSLIFIHIGSWLDKKLSPDLFNNIIENQASDKNLNSQNLRDLQIIKSFISGPNLAIIFDAPFALVYLIFIFFIHPINGLITVVGALILLKMAFINENSTHQLIEQSNQLQIDVMKNFEIISSNSEVILAMAMKGNVRDKWQAGNSKLQDLNNKLAVRSNVISSTTKIIRLLIQMITMAASAALVIFNKMSSGGIIATSILAGKALAPFDSAVSLWKSIITVRKSYSRLNQSLKSYKINQEKILLPDIRGEITVEKLSYKLPGLDKLIIKNISFQIDPGQIIAIVGKSGSGKTTLARLLVGAIKPSAGNIRIDDANLADQNFEEIGKFIGYLPQGIELFKGSVKENIARMNKDVKDQEVIMAAEFCSNHQMILRLNTGYETPIEKDARNLSGGQKQRIALSRAFFGQVKFVVLDEPNSNLDQEGEMALIKTLKTAKENKITIVIITHKPSIASFCDKVLLLQDGEIKAFDEAKTLIKNPT
jgi:PrtD family type I secretion system ABC transporter